VTDGVHDAGLMRLSFEALADRLLDDIDPLTLAAGSFVEIGRYRLAGTEDRTGIVVLSPSAIAMPVDVLPIDRWQTPEEYGPT
jgi:hypothetical protein